MYTNTMATGHRSLESWMEKKSWIKIVKIQLHHFILQYMYMTYMYDHVLMMKTITTYDNTGVGAKRIQVGA